MSEDPQNASEAAHSEQRSHEQPNLRLRVSHILAQANDCRDRASASADSETRSMYLGLAATYETLAQELTKTADTIEAVRSSAYKLAKADGR